MQDVLTSLRLLVLSVLVCCVAYPLAVLGFARAVTPEASRGSLLTDEDGTVVGSRLVAQRFTEPGYFWPRPSAVDYDAGAAGGSNLSPANPEITGRAEELIARLDPPEGARVPADLVTASGSGLDPHITLAAARLQVPRVAAARRLPEEDVHSLVERHTDSPTLIALGGEPLVNVLELNIALDRVDKDD
jgi:K+-transporting ATPase ATPase C chain